ncbi:RNA-directed DNA polymerase [Chryseobacterium fistulae]|uniref:Reverse transcriptase domain-containing protein n=1 Tax=Chryseobacterium fistulae TaxID=2675058 RepID=A0A6N4XZ01_9FLAO|nr:RNA-directed DNA polymerase [Chryseobacterium fistulae]CAA7392616.1 hypothetical protein CHRY9393_03341 [Chryseobacterium fistulae]
MQQLKENLFQAYYLARKNKRNTYNQLRFELHYEQELWKLYDDIITGNYQIGNSVAFIVDKPVKREIFAADFRDRIMHHLIFLYINPILEAHFIEDSYSCRKNKGTLYGVRKAEQYMGEVSGHFTRDAYILTLDIQGFFMSINKGILMEKLREMITENVFVEYWRKQADHHPENDLSYEMLMSLLENIVHHSPESSCRMKGSFSQWEGLPASKSLFTSPTHCGLAIGNLTSQLFSNVYLCSFDHFIKERLGIEYYGRYVDDFFIMHESKDELKSLVGICRDYLQEHNRLTLHPNKIYLQHYSKGFSFLGAYIKPFRTYIGKRTKKNFKSLVHNHTQMLREQEEIDKASIHKLRSGLNSYLGLLKHYKTYNLRKKILFKTGSSYERCGYFPSELNKIILYKDCIVGKNSLKRVSLC